MLIFGDPAPMSARNLSKIAHTQLPAPPPTVQRGWIAQSAGKRAEAKQVVQGQDVIPKERTVARSPAAPMARSCSTTHYLRPTPAKTIALLQRRADDAASVCFGLFKSR